MKCKLILVVEEACTLEEMAEHHPVADFRPRALSLLALADGMLERDIAHFLRVSKQTSYQWSYDCKPAGLVGILDGAFDIESRNLIFDTVTTTITRDKVVAFLDELARSNDDRPLVIILDNEATHHHIDSAIKYRWLVNHHMMLWHLPPYSPSLNPIEIVWKQAKYFWRQFNTLPKAIFESDFRPLVSGYGSKIQINFA